MRAVCDEREIKYGQTSRAAGARAENFGNRLLGIRARRWIFSAGKNDLSNYFDFCFSVVVV